MAALGQLPQVGGGVKDFLAGLGFGTMESDKKAEEALKQARKYYEDLDPVDLIEQKPAFAEDLYQDPTAMNEIDLDPTYRASQLDQLAALSNLARGGRNAQSDYDLAQLQASENAQARGSRDAVIQNMQARGMGGSGADLIAQLSANQAAQQNANAQGLNVLANKQNTAINAGTAAANIGAGMQSQDYNQQAAKAQAADAIKKFNTSNTLSNRQYNSQANNQAQQFNTGLQQTEYQNKAQKASGLSGTSIADMNYNLQKADQKAKQSSAMAQGLFKLGGAAYGAYKGGSTPEAARGGKIGGIAPVRGDSKLNDIVPIKVSPGEVVVPRSVVQRGHPKEIAHFVKNAPTVHGALDDKESILAALRNISKRGMKL